MATLLSAAARTARRGGASTHPREEGHVMGLNEYALECLAKERLAALRAAAAVQQLLPASARQGWIRRAMTASSWHFLKPYAVRPRTPGPSSAAS